MTSCQPEVGHKPRILRRQGPGCLLNRRPAWAAFPRKTPALRKKACRGEGMGTARRGSPCPAGPAPQRTCDNNADNKRSPGSGAPRLSCPGRGCAQPPTHGSGSPWDGRGLLQVQRSRSREACVTELDPGWRRGQRDTPAHACGRAPEGASTSPAVPRPPAHRPASPACRSPAAPAVSAWASLPTWLRQRGPGGRGPGAAGQSRLGLRRSPGGGAGGTDGFASLSSLPSSASPLLAPSTLSPLRGSEGPSVAPGTQVTRHTASVTHGALSPARVPRGLWASIWAEGHPSSQPASG